MRGLEVWAKTVPMEMAPDEGAGAEAAVEDAVVGRVGVDVQVVGRHHRHLAQEGQGQQREDEDGDQAAAHHLVGPGHRHPGQQLAPVGLAGHQARRHRRQGHHHQGQHHEEIGHGIAAEDPGRPDEVVGHRRRWAGPMTRDRFIWAELSEMAPGMSSLPTRPGSTAE